MFNKLLAFFIAFIFFLTVAFFHKSDFVFAKFFGEKSYRACVVIDVGHGGFDPGKVSTKGVMEKDINLEIAKYLRDYLINNDYLVYLDREKDCDLVTDSHNKKVSDLRNRVAFIKEKKADFVISIHQNSFPDSSVSGSQVFYYTKSAEGKQMANFVQTALESIEGVKSREVKGNDEYYMLKKPEVPVVLIECGFLSNEEEVERLQDPDYQKRIAYGICQGICRAQKRKTQK